MGKARSSVRRSSPRPFPGRFGLWRVSRDRADRTIALEHSSGLHGRVLNHAQNSTAGPASRCCTAPRPDRVRVFESDRRLVSRRVAMESVLESHTVCESLELSKVRIGPETTELRGDTAVPRRARVCPSVDRISVVSSPIRTIDRVLKSHRTRASRVSSRSSFVSRLVSTILKYSELATVGDRNVRARRGARASDTPSNTLSVPKGRRAKGTRRPRRCSSRQATLARVSFRRSLWRSLRRSLWRCLYRGVSQEMCLPLIGAQAPTSRRGRI